MKILFFPVILYAKIMCWYHLKCADIRNGNNVENIKHHLNRWNYHHKTLDKFGLGIKLNPREEEKQ